MSEALRLLGQSIEKCDAMEKTLALVKGAKVDFQNRLETLTEAHADLKNDAEGHRKANEAHERRIEDLERANKELDEERVDIQRIRNILDNAGIQGPSDIAAGTEVSSRVREVVEENEERGKREFILMKFINDNGGQLKDGSEAIKEAIAIIKANLPEGGK